MLSCKEVSRKIASDELADAGLVERLMIRFHLWRCGDCSSYREQLSTIGTQMRQRAHEEGATPSALERLERRILDAGAAGRSSRADDVDD